MKVVFDHFPNFIYTKTIKMVQYLNVSGLGVEPDSKISPSNLRVRRTGHLRRRQLRKAPDARVPQRDVVWVSVQTDDAVAGSDQPDVAEHVVQERREVVVDDVVCVAPQQGDDSSVGSVAAAADHHHLRIVHAGDRAVVLGDEGVVADDGAP